MLRLIDMRNGQDRSLFDELASRSQMDLGNVHETVGNIIRDVKEQGDKAILKYTKEFDKTEPESIRMDPEKLSEAAEKVDEKLKSILKKAKINIEKFHEKQKENSWFTNEPGMMLGQLYRPLDTVGIYVPGGTAPLPSSVLMNTIPARVAGVRKVVMATPPSKDGGVNPVIAAAALCAGVDEVYLMGGAQAIAALAFGTESVLKCDKIAGPGNIYVNTAKRQVFGYCDIDMFAGPSEIAVIADASANPGFIAADLLSQAEHDPLSAAILITDSQELAAEVCVEVERQLSELPRKDIASRSISRYGTAIIVNSMAEAVDTANLIAPEHLELCVDEPLDLLGSIKNAGAVFMGSYSSEPLGDYFAGPNHVLPTSGTARFFSPLNVSDFIKKTSVIYYTKDALKKVKDDIVDFAEAEGLKGHANAIRARFEEKGR